MPLGINGYNDAFKTFTDFATQAKGGSTIAQISGEKNEAAGSSPLAGRTIVAKTSFDFVGNVGRRQASRDVNNDVRQVCCGNKAVDAKKLLDDISDVLFKKPPTPPDST